MPPEAFLDKSSKVFVGFHNAANVAGRENLSNPSSKLKSKYFIKYFKKGIPSAFARNY